MVTTRRDTKPDTRRASHAFGPRTGRSAGLFALVVAVLVAGSASVAGCTPSVGGGPARVVAASGTPDATSTPDTSRTPPDTTSTPNSPRTRLEPPSHAIWTIGYSVQGRPIVAETFGTGSRRVLIVGGIHGNELGAAIAEAFLRSVQANPSVVPRGTELDIVACANPDGCACDRRTNAHNVDLNRNFPASNWSRVRNVSGASSGGGPVSEPETRALLRLLDTKRYARVVSLHSSGGFVDWDGPGGLTLAERIASAAHVPLKRLPRYHGSMGSFVPQRYRIPIVTWELTRSTIDARIWAGLLAAVR